jgi:hypothetical protein
MASRFGIDVATGSSTVIALCWILFVRFEAISVRSKDCTGAKSELRNLNKVAWQMVHRMSGQNCVTDGVFAFRLRLNLQALPEHVSIQLPLDKARKLGWQFDFPLGWFISMCTYFQNYWYGVRSIRIFEELSFTGVGNIA